MAGILFIISAPSGSGKSTLVNALRSQLGRLDFSVSWTTRQPRGSEQNGREYYFTTREEFERMIAAGEFLEHAEVFGNYYGTAQRSLDEATAAGHDLILDIDVQGAMQVMSKLPEAVTIFVMPPNPKVLKTRLRNRSRAEGEVNEDVLNRRLDAAKREIENYRRYRYILVNDVLERAVAQLEAVVAVERMRREGTPLDHRTKREFEIAESCRVVNSRERLRPFLESFGIDPGEDPQQPRLL
ncbi:guanylate kinase [Acidicapsa dinghuensis]|uniref:Guanylate kinase n=1 Tax=Acidicapsa dinghuensis TaxID=2218256 RepID=A0ABW1EMY3_9BACT|nr:guanylate kinase [Acidicapsa dinghuensis]